MKKILLTLLLTSASVTHADCLLIAYADQGFWDIQKKAGGGWNFPSYDKLCEKLKKHDLGVGISTTSFITTQQTVASSTLRLYSNDIYKKYNLIVMTSLVTNSISANMERTTARQQALVYDDVNNALEILANGDEDFWNKNLNEIKNLKKNMK